jgi:hypothetical protein
MAKALVPEWKPKTGERPRITPITGPVVGRRDFFKLVGTGVTGFALTPLFKADAQGAQSYGAKLTGKARNCIFILLTGAPSHSDTFDLKVGAWTPADFNPTTYKGTLFPQGLMPKLAEKLDTLSLIRSLRAPALVHPLQQSWVQMARSPNSALGKIAPNIGSVVALEFEAKRQAGQKLPVFVSLNTGQNIVGSGYFSGLYAPFDLQPAPTGITSLANADGQAKFEQRYNILQAIDARLRTDSPLGDDATTLGGFYDRGKGMMYDTTVDAVFKFSTDEQTRYGSSTFGDSCIVARNLVAANQGTRYIQINFGSWDHHQDIYAKSATPNQTVPGIYQMTQGLDDGLAALLGDLAAQRGVNGGTLLDETLIVAMGEFGRTVGPLTNQDGRDHYFQQFAVLAGGGVQGGRVIGQTTADGGSVQEPGWSQGRAVAYEDVAATIYSALGIDYTTIRHDDPFGRGFEYVPFASEGAWYPVLELFTRDVNGRPGMGGRDSGRRVG